MEAAAFEPRGAPDRRPRRRRPTMRPGRPHQASSWWSRTMLMPRSAGRLAGFGCAACASPAPVDGRRPEGPQATTSPACPARWPARSRSERASSQPSEARRGLAGAGRGSAAVSAGARRAFDGASSSVTGEGTQRRPRGQRVWACSIRERPERGVTSRSRPRARRDRAWTPSCPSAPRIRRRAASSAWASHRPGAGAPESRNVDRGGDRLELVVAGSSPTRCCSTCRKLGANPGVSSRI